MTDDDEYGEVVDIDFQPQLDDLVRDYCQDLTTTLVSIALVHKKGLVRERQLLPALVELIGALTASYMREATQRCIQQTVEALGYEFHETELTAEGFDE